MRRRRRVGRARAVRPRRVPIAHGIPAISTQRPSPSEKLIPSDILPPTTESNTAPRGAPAAAVPSFAAIAAA